MPIEFSDIKEPIKFPNTKEHTSWLPSSIHMPEGLLGISGQDPHKLITKELLRLYPKIDVPERIISNYSKIGSALGNLAKPKVNPEQNEDKYHQTILRNIHKYVNPKDFKHYEKLYGILANIHNKNVGEGKAPKYATKINPVDPKTYFKSMYYRSNPALFKEPIKGPELFDDINDSVRRSMTGKNIHFGNLKRFLEDVYKKYKSTTSNLGELKRSISDKAIQILKRNHNIGVHRTKDATKQPPIQQNNKIG